MDLFLGFLYCFFGQYVFFLCQDYAILVTTALWHMLESRSMMTPALFFCSRLIWLFSVFCVLKSTLELYLWVLWINMNAIELVNCFGKHEHFNNIKSFNPQTWATWTIFPFACFCQLLSSIFYSFHYAVHLLLWLNVFIDILF